MEFWNKCSEKLENKLSQEDFNTWIRPLKGNLNKNTLEIIAPNDFILNYVETNLSDEIMEMIKSQSKKDISLVFKTLTKETFVDKLHVLEEFLRGIGRTDIAAGSQMASRPVSVHVFQRAQIELEVCR